MKNYIGNLILIVFSVLLILVLLEVFTCVLYKNEYRNFYDHRISQPAPYQDSEYFSKEFIKESNLDQPGKWINPEGTRIIYPDNYQGKYFTVKDHLRFTTDQPTTYNHTVHLFGGSTIYNSEVPDKYTVASYLQRALNEKVPDQFQVLNYGATSINTAQQLERLKTIDIKADDIVVFYGGVNDALLFTSGKINGWIVGENINAYNTQLNFIQKVRFKIYKKLKKRSCFVAKFLNPYAYQMPEHLKDTARIDQMKTQLADSYHESITTADSLSKSKEASFYNFLQPTILTRSNRTPYEEGLLKNKFLIAEAWIKAIRLSYTVLPEVNRQLQQQEINSKDLTAVLDQTSESHYLDYCHITEKGNSLVATSICNTILQSN